MIESILTCRRASSALVLAFLILMLQTPKAPARQGAPPGRAWTPELMMQVRQIGGVDISPDGKRVVYTARKALMEGEKSEYLTHLHLANADGSMPLQLTQGVHSCDSPQWSPDGESIAFLSKRLGKRNIWIIRVQAGEARVLTAVKDSVGSFKWSPDGQSIAFTALDPLTSEEEKATKEKNDARVVDENIKMSRLYVISSRPTNGPPAEARLLTKGNYSVGNEGGRTGRAFDWSPDGKALVFSRTSTPRPDDWTSADLMLVDVASGTVKPLVQTRAAETLPCFSPDGRRIAYVASDNPPTWGGSGVIHVIPANGGVPRSLTETFDRFGRYSDLIGWSADGSKLYYAEARGTTLQVGALPLDAKPQQISQADGMMVGGVHLNHSRTKLGFAWEGLTRPAEAYVSAVERFEPAQVSRENQDVAVPPLGRTEVVRWKSADALEVEGLLTYPVGYEKGKRYPLLLVIHGGPMGVFSQNYIGASGLYPIAAFASRGYAVLRCNIRGSSGYGQKFRHANYGDWGGMDYKDLMTGVDHVVAAGVADPERLGVMGWSYGGYMTSWVITQTRRFRAASVGAGVTNLMSFTGTADIPGFLPDYFGGEPWDKLDTYRAHSAMFNVKGVSTPTLIQHGERDERVPLSQGQELYNALKRQGCTVKMVIYPRTPHGIEEPKLLLDCMRRNLEWFDLYVKGNGS
jgi:dipeptidyl aminopeptidase/acylaminoacyl peptidase